LLRRSSETNASGMAASSAGSAKALSSANKTVPAVAIVVGRVTVCWDDGVPLLLPGCVLLFFAYLFLSLSTGV
jgi:hypothetical protein